MNITVRMEMFPEKERIPVIEDVKMFLCRTVTDPANRVQSEKHQPEQVCLTLKRICFYIIGIPKIQ